jgi:hypothetical protein
MVSGYDVLRAALAGRGTHHGPVVGFSVWQTLVALAVLPAIYLGAGVGVGMLRGLRRGTGDAGSEDLPYLWMQSIPLTAIVYNLMTCPPMGRALFMLGGKRGVGFAAVTHWCAVWVPSALTCYLALRACHRHRVSMAIGLVANSLFWAVGVIALTLRAT